MTDQDDEYEMLEYSIDDACDAILQQYLESMGIFRFPVMPEGEHAPTVTDYLIYAGIPSSIRSRLDLFM